MTDEQIAGELMTTTEDVAARATEMELTSNDNLQGSSIIRHFASRYATPFDEVEAGGDAVLAREAVENAAVARRP